MANNMHYYNMGLNLVGDFVDKCLDIVKAQIEKMPNRRLHFNHSEYIFLKENEDGKIVPFVHYHLSPHAENRDVEMYSFDGWLRPEDVGNWADVAIQIVEDINNGDAARWGYEEGFKIEEKAELKA